MSCVWPVQIQDSNGNSLNSTSGSLDVNVTSLPSSSLKATYSVGIQGLSGYTPLIQVQGSSTKTIKIRRVIFNGVPGGTGSLPMDVFIRRYSSGATGGTIQAATPAKLNTSDAAATATVNYWTAAPTEGTLVATVAVQRWIISTSTNPPPIADFEFGTRPDTEPFTLQGTGDYFVVDINPTIPGSYPSAVVDLWIEFTEE